MTTVMSPFGSQWQPPKAELAPRPGTLQGLRLGLLDNSKPNAALLLDAVLEELEDELRPSVVVRRRKPGAGVPGPESLLEELQSTCDAVIVAVGD